MSHRENKKQKTAINSPIIRNEQTLEKKNPYLQLDEYNNNILMLKIMNNENDGEITKIIRDNIDNHVFLNQINNFNETPFLIACKKYKERHAIQILNILGYNIDFNLVNYEGYTSLTYALRYNMITLLDILVKKYYVSKIKLGFINTRIEYCSNLLFSIQNKNSNFVKIILNGMDVYELFNNMILINNYCLQLGSYRNLEKKSFEKILNALRILHKEKRSNLMIKEKKLKITNNLPKDVFNEVYQYTYLFE